ncbi:MAG: ABC transporter substrate-binding protein [Desulfuromonadales bacterium]|nr:ABC transporter substrate-binding protein [Desulfuromonadales bacterium]
MKRLLLMLLAACCTTGLLLSTPRPVAAEPILAAIVPADLPRYKEAHKAMAQILETGGFGAGKLKIMVQAPNADKMSIVNSARRADSAGAAIIVVYGSRAAESLASEPLKAPLLFADVYDPVALGVVKSLTTTGAEVTGASSKTDLDSLAGHMLKITGAKTIGVLYTKDEGGAEQQLAELKKAGVTIKAENVRNQGEAVAAAEKLAGQCDALYLTESIAVMQQGPAIVKAALAQKKPVFSQIPDLVKAGALLGLEAEPDEQGKLVGVHALQILQGQKAHSLPVRSAKKITLMINPGTAAQLGLTIPPDVLSAGQAVK